MSMFDWYRPTSTAKCPQCGAALKEWQGKDGPCALFIWKQGHRNPIDQQVEDEELQWSDEERRRFVLPEHFVIYSYDCPNHQPVEAKCTCIDGVWSNLEIVGLQYDLRL